MARWFQVWNRPEYKEYAFKIRSGVYLLLIIAKQENGFLCARANLKMKKKDLPEFELLEKIEVRTEKQAEKQINIWKNKK